MKLKYSKLALALPMSVAGFAFAATDTVDNGFANNVTPSHIQAGQQKALNQAAHKNNKHRYFVMLQDAPLAMYNGGLAGLDATNVKASNGKNKADNGKLNTKSAASVNYATYLKQQQVQVKLHINLAIKRTVEVKETFQTLLNAMVVELSEQEANQIANLQGVMAVQKEERDRLLTDRGPIHVGAPDIWEHSEGGFKGEGVVVGIMDTGIQPFPEYKWDGSYTEEDFHPAFADIGADGYDHTNPNGDGVYFGDCTANEQWCNDKLIGIVSFEEITSQYSQWDLERFGNGKDSHGHGTHVASTAAGNVVNDVQVVNAIGELGEFEFETVTGVAPHANIISYQTCHPTLGCWPSLAIKSVEHAIENGVDVMNYSVGNDDATSPWYDADALAFLSAREAGIHIAVSAGNNGWSGPATVGSPGNSPWVNTVAAYTHDRSFTEKEASFTGGEMSLSAMSGKGATSGVEGLELIYAGNIQSEYDRDTFGDGVCGGVNWSEYEAPAGKVLVCKRGGVDWSGEPLARVHKSKTAKDWGAAGMILINTDETSDTTNADFHSVPTIHINQEDGAALLAWMATGVGHTVTFNDSVVEADAEVADVAADFSARGPEKWSPDYLVPDIAAPGVEIYAGGIGYGNHYWELDSAAQVEGTYRFMSGTSMSSPHMAGVLALMSGMRPDWTPAEVQSALMMTAETFTYTDDDYDGVKTMSTPFDAGAGSARVNRAINAGLIMPETKANYLAANPLAESMGDVDSIEDWHGEPSQMNLASLSKGSCLIECEWTRTFKATTSGTWTVSSSQSSEGFTLVPSQTELTLSEGESIDLSFTAIANEALSEEWVFGRVILTPQDESLPVQTMPVAVNFIAGEAPEIFSLEAHRDNDSAMGPEVTSIGSDSLQSSSSELVEAKIVEFEIARDMDNTQVLTMPMNDSLYAIPLNIPARAKRFVVEVLETTSPDLDVYIGVDIDLNGQPDFSEFDFNTLYYSAGETAFEKVDELAPLNATYWILVHNWAAQELDAEAVIDTVKLAYGVVEIEDDSLMVEAPDSVEARAMIDMRVKWNKEMTEGGKYYGTMALGTSPEASENIGTIRVDITRGEDDLAITEPIVDDATGTVSIDLQMVANTNPEDKTYTFEVEVASGTQILSLIQNAVEAATTTMTSSNTVDFEFDGSVLSWQHTQGKEAPAISYSLVLDINSVEGMADVTPVVTAMVSTSDESVVKAPTEPVLIEGRPVFSVSASSTSIKENGFVTLTAQDIDLVIDEPTVSYQWQQVSGPSVTLNTVGSTASFAAPKVSSTQTLVFELIGSNGSKSSLPAEVSVDVTNKSSGGSTGLITMLLLGLALLARRYKGYQLS